VRIEEASWTVRASHRAPLTDFHRQLSGLRCRLSCSASWSSV